MLTIYISGNSRLHRASPRLKFLLLFAFALCVAATNNPLALLAFGLMTTFAYWLAGLSVPHIWMALRPVIPFLVVIVAAQWVLIDLASAITSAARAIILVVAASLIPYTTRASDMVDAFITATRPLARFGLHPNKVSLAFMLAMRFIPAMAETYAEVKLARQARGGRRFGPSVLGQLMIAALQKADEVADAVTARGFEDRGGDAR